MHAFRILLVSAGLFAALSVRAQVPPGINVDSQVTFADASSTSSAAGSTDDSRMTISQVQPDLVAPAIPEPETYALMLAGLGVVGLIARRRR